MELIFIAFVGTLALMAGELRDLVRRSHTASGIAPEPVAASDVSGRSVVYDSVDAEEKLYDAAA